MPNDNGGGWGAGLSVYEWWRLAQLHRKNHEKIAEKKGSLGVYPPYLRRRRRRGEEKEVIKE